MAEPAQVLFLCTGNYYRSRFAEAFFNWHAESRLLPWRAQSRGLALQACNVGPLSEFTVARLQQHGIPAEPYLRLPQDLATTDLATAQLVVAVKRDEHYPMIQERFPEWLGNVEFWDVHDVDLATPADALPRLERHVLELLDRLGGG